MRVATVSGVVLPHATTATVSSVTLPHAVSLEQQLSLVSQATPAVVSKGTTATIAELIEIPTKMAKTTPFAWT
jgi:hypothetical protein